MSDLDGQEAPSSWLLGGQRRWVLYTGLSHPWHVAVVPVCDAHPCFSRRNVGSVARTVHGICTAKPGAFPRGLDTRGRGTPPTTRGAVREGGAFTPAGGHAVSGALREVRVQVFQSVVRVGNYKPRPQNPGDKERPVFPRAAPRGTAVLWEALLPGDTEMRPGISTISCDPNVL